MFPRKCPICDSCLDLDEKLICTECLDDIPFTYFWLWKNNPAKKRMDSLCPVENAVSLFFYRYTGGYGHIIHQLKYHGRTQYGIVFGRMLGEKMGEKGIFSDIDAIVPVPLHFIRKWKRGFNQSVIIAKGIASAFTSTGLKEPVIAYNLLRRRKNTKTQTRLSLDEKKKNVSRAFQLRKINVAKMTDEGIRHILIVDDVLTSGSTLAACTSLLTPHFKVSVATLGYVE